MKYKKGAWMTIVGVIIAILLVGAVAYIVFSSIGKSSTSIFEPLKKMIGLETEEVAINQGNKGECIIKRVYWGKDKAQVNEEVDIVVEGNENCNGKEVKINIFKDKLLWFDGDPKISLDGNFDENKVIASWLSNEKGEFYFKMRLGNYETPESKRLKIE